MRIGLTAAMSVLLGVTAAGQGPPVKIPLRPGLTVVVAFAMPDGDGESIGRLDTVDSRGLHFTLSGEKIVREGGGTGLEGLPGLEELFGTPKKSGGASQKPKVQRIQTKRSVLAADLQTARHLQAQFSNGDPTVFPGSTTLRLSTLVYNELKTKGQTEMSCQCATGMAAMVGGLGKALGGVLGGPGVAPELKDLEDMGRLSGTVKRVGNGTVPVAVILNGSRVNLPAIHARGVLGGEDADFYFLDDPENPMSLSLQVGDNRAQVVKVTFTAEANARPIAVALETAGRAEVYGIYFDFASDTIKPESEPVLREIADALTNNAAWKLTVEGHTDNVGGDNYNLDLSRRRAAAVKTALVSRHKIAADRLVTSGFGASRPKETNDTLEGRATNRRVELVRQ